MTETNDVIIHPQSRKYSKRFWRVILYLAITLAALIFILPIIGVIMTSIKLDSEIAREGLWVIPKTIHFDNFKTVWVTAHVNRYMLNSLLVTIPATFISIALGVLLGYVFSKLPFPGAEILFIVVMAGMFFPPKSS